MGQRGYLHLCMCVADDVTSSKKVFRKRLSSEAENCSSGNDKDFTPAALKKTLSVHAYGKGVGIQCFSRFSGSGLMHRPLQDDSL